MAYPEASQDDIDFFSHHGWIIVRDAVDPDDIQTLREKCLEIIDRRDELAFDWAWEKGTDKEDRPFRILQSSPTLIWPEFNDASKHMSSVILSGLLLAITVSRLAPAARELE